MSSERVDSMDMSPEEDLENRFKHHPPKNGQVERYEALRGHGLDLCLHILGQCPASRERSLAITKIEEAVMWANAAIARNE